MKILIINGPNLNMLGTREPEKYGFETLADIEKELYAYSFELSVDIETFQSNIEGEIIDKIQKANFGFDGIVINPGGYSHTSVAIRDAISAVNLPCIEVHMTNVHAREEFRHNSLIAPVCIGQITGFKKNVYKLGLSAICEYLNSK
ncbi:MAG TPA: type II 3-dehydroquinate dehydratase [Candidatus Gastranaerophilaceae bacterium]|nr:type II 3-dehydroquinate dehydratase [Candidatus Gastranaerophilaceae bacterium]HPT41192.1 type II 3-dehydroquinate dehydratase [Candidatus Gastranaerophilaceae bacterium]